MNNNKSNFNLSRRNTLKLGAGFLGAASLTTALGLNLSKPEPVVAQNNMTPDEALTKLMSGNERFVTRKRQYPNQDTARLTETAKGQIPFAAVLSCADSRVPVEIIFDQGLGDIFVVRDAGNIATPEEIGSLEFGTLVLGSKVLMVIGHEACGAVKAAMQGGEVPGSIGSVLEQISPAITDYQGLQDSKVDLKKATIANVLYQIEKLKSSPVLSQLISENKLKVVGAYYELDTGEISTVS